MTPETIDVARVAFALGIIVGALLQALPGWLLMQQRRGRR